MYSENLNGYNNGLSAGNQKYIFKSIKTYYWVGSSETTRGNLFIKVWSKFSWKSNTQSLKNESLNYERYCNNKLT